MNLDVIIPVGPGHEELHKRAVESVRIASLHKGPFSRINVRIVDDTLGAMGRSRARNKALKESQAKWVFFLDADDVLHPDCFKNFRQGYEAVFGQISELDQGTVKWRYQVPEISSFQELIAFDPYLTLQMGHFVRREVAKSIGFDESMDTGEDWKYYLELWKKHRCVKINKPLFINSRGNHSTGQRSATGQDWRGVVNGLIAEARND